MDQLWWGYIGTGGSMSLGQMVAVLQDPDVSTWEYDHLAQAINEHFVDAGGDHPVAYSDEVQ